MSNYYIAVSAIEETYSVVSAGVAGERMPKVLGNYIIERVDNKCIDEAIIIYKHETEDFYMLNTTDSWIVFSSNQDEVLLRRPVSSTSMSIPSEGWLFLAESNSGKSYMNDSSIQILPKGGRYLCSLFYI